ncbi:MAG: trans-4-hydroxy-L-proline dehydratase [Candidatus Hermodarchaeota archaeon]
MLSERVQRLRDHSIRARPYISSERAELLTDFFEQHVKEGESIPVKRALAFKHILENKALYFGDGELIVGERGPEPKATPTYPELCCHSLKDFDVLESRDVAPFAVSYDVRTVYGERIIPFWKGKTMREFVFSAVSSEWLLAYSAGVFTEFMEQRAPGHAILDDKIYNRGLLDLKQEIEASIASLDFDKDPESALKEEELKAMAITIDALIHFAERYAKKALELAENEKNPLRKEELEKIAAVCSHVPSHAPRDFWEALQMYWFVHLGVITELNVWDSFNPGRLDQHLLPFFQAEIEAGTLSKEFAKELLQCFWVKFNNQPAPPKVDVTVEQSGTYQDFALINVGGLTPDGEDAVNELSYMILDVCKEMQLIMPSLCIQLSSKNPDQFLHHALTVVKAGFGQPSIFNTDVIIQEFLRAGKSQEDALNGGPSGCVTISAFGKESCILTGYCNWPKILELALNNGQDSLTGKQVGPTTGKATGFTSFNDVLLAYKQQLQYFINLKINGNNRIERLFAQNMPAPFLSLLFDDCIKKGKDYHDGGPRYNSTYIQGVGLGTLTDSLSAVKYHAFDKRTVSISSLIRALNKNFEDNEELRQRLITEAPKFGNDDDYADSIAQEIFDAYFSVIDGRPNTKGGEYRVNLLPTTVHIYFGRITGATPNGRKAGYPLSDGISPSHGSDTCGPTAVIRSVSKIDHVKTGGTLLNQKLLPKLLNTEAGIEKLSALISTYFKLGGHHIQFNVIDAHTLKDAQQHPELYRDLIVRVAGYSDYFVDIGKDLQDEIIARTTQDEF